MSVAVRSAHDGGGANVVHHRHRGVGATPEFGYHVALEGVVLGARLRPIEQWDLTNSCGESANYFHVSPPAFAGRA